MIEHIALGPGAEFDRIRGILRRLGPRAGRMGDDCAVVLVGSETLAVSCDLSVEGTHFRMGWMTGEEIGWRATAAALSDLAAAAAHPAGVMVSLGTSAEYPEERLAEIMDGAGDAARSVDAIVWGGDLVRADTLTIDVCVIGRVTGQASSRRGARTGDALWVTGRLGGPHAALASWLEGREPDAQARHRFVHPQPRVREARWLKDHGATAMIDLSDGLMPDARQLAAASSVSLTVNAESVPVHEAATTAAALIGGEEYELLLSLPAGFEAAAEFEKTFGIPLTRVGDVGKGSGVVVTRAGEVVEVGRGYEHF